MIMSTTYINWKNLKYELILSEASPPRFNERDIWWCSIGLNVGYEINGKNDLVERPVLVLKKYNNSMFFGLPLTTKQKNYDSRHSTNVNGKDADIILDQGKSFSAKRLNRRERVIGYKEFDLVKQKLSTFLSLDTITAPEGAVATNVDYCN